jgi:hypothetical protein
MSSCSREKVLLYSQKRELEYTLPSTLSKNREFGMYPMNKTGGRRIMFITRTNAANWESRCSAPFSSPFSG